MPPARSPEAAGGSALATSLRARLLKEEKSWTPPRSGTPTERCWTLSATVADSGDAIPALPSGEWNADQVLAHVSLVSAATITAASAVASGANTTYDNGTALRFLTTCS
jgi:hypothetical protein